MVEGAGADPGLPAKGERTMKSSFRAIRLLVVAAALFLVVGAASLANAGSQAKVTINVAALRPGSSADAQKQFDDNVALFEKQHPNIAVKPVEYAWNGATFAAQLAAGRLPTVFTVPFTDARTLGEHRQVADITAGVKKWAYYKKFQKTIIAEATTSKGRIIGVPYAAYAQALHYNRQLFKEAGLDPNKPPTTWAQLRKYAKQISQRTGAAGYAQMGLNDNTAGWIATTVAYTLGGRMEQGRGANATANAQQSVHGSGAEPAEADALDRQVDGLHVRLHLAHDQPGLRGRQDRHVHQRLGHLHVPRPGREPRSEDLRHRTASACEAEERRCHGRWLDRGRSAGHEGCEAGRRPPVDRLLLHGEAHQEAGCASRCTDSRRQPASRSVSQPFRSSTRRNTTAPTPGSSRTSTFRSSR